ncbi:hypothetical protein DER44DRAFT_677893, partial [Fusarium oxysporum]
EAWKRTLGEEHPSTLTSKSNLAITWKDQRHSGDTLVLMRNYRVLAQRVLGTDHPNTTSSVALLAQWEDTSDSL